MELGFSVRQIVSIFSILFVFSVPAAGQINTPIYDLAGRWLTVDGVSTTVAVGRGRYVLLGMLYTGCTSACPMTISKMQDIERDLTKKGGVENLKLVLASFDVKRDRPDNLKKFLKTRKLDPEKWILLSPQSESDARELSVALGISYKEIGGGDFSHSNVISLLDPSGVVVARTESLTASNAPFVDAFKKRK